MGVLGQSLPTPDAGWQRIDDTNTNISYTGVWNTGAYTNSFGGTSKYASGIGSTAKFNFTGTGFRLFASTDFNRVGNTLQITIDGASENFSEYSASRIEWCLVYEKTGLANTEHCVTIGSPVTNCNDSSAIFFFDGFDIYDSESVLPYNENITKAQLLSGGM